ncbi:MAG TPA: response regulator [Gemmatimonadaceae bacterium]|nr:response regulator [Gemmatimonadaceae bacterium]
MSDSDSPLRPPLVLLADDQEWSSRSLESILGPNGYAVLRAYTGRQAVDLARSAQPDLLIVDAKLPDMSGFDVCRHIRAASEFGSSTPMIITTSGPAERAQRIAAYEAGAWEYLGQPIDGELLLLKLRAYMNAKRETNRIHDERLVDSATGLYTVRGLARRAQEVGAQAQRRHDALACVAFAPDADDMADDAPEQESRVMKWAEQIGDVTRRTGRACDIIGRLGPLEFAIIAPETEAKGVLCLLERLQLALAALPGRSDGNVAMKIRAGYCAVPDFAESPTDAVEMLLRATTTLRQLRTSADPERIRAFGAAPISSSSR